MGRGKIEIKKIENVRNRNAAYKSRHVGLMKKTFEISVLSNIPAVLITFSPAKKLCIFSRLNRCDTHMH
jgi:SRF-type transcription factor (DNA-binding and dimerisation domain)